VTDCIRLVERYTAPGLSFSAYDIMAKTASWERMGLSSFESTEAM